MKILLTGSKAETSRAKVMLSKAHEVHVSEYEQASALASALKPEIVVMVAPGTSVTPEFEKTVRELEEGAATILAFNNPSQFLKIGEILNLGKIHDLVVPSANFNENIGKSVSLLEHYLKNYLAPPPAFGSDSWIQSMASEESKTLYFSTIPRYARYQFENPVITGLTGTGKTQVAKALHHLSGRTGPFVAITPRDFSSSELVQAELFGSTAGAYTGAVDKWGLVKKAEKGTLFIDELQSIDFDLQGKIITFIENKVYRRIGSTESNTADVRFIFATNRGLRELVDSEKIRDDFAWRLEGLRIELSPLNERPLDISAACCFALAKVDTERSVDFSVTGFTEPAYNLLLSQEWPGNLRQLANSVASMVDRSSMKKEKLISVETLRETLGIENKNNLEQALILAARRTASDSSYDNWDELTLELQRELRLAALEVCDNDTARAAELIGTDESKIKLVKSSHGT